MTKITLAVSSFAIGAFSALLLGHQTSTFAQQAAQPSQPTFIRVDGAAPVVPPLRGITVTGYAVRNMNFALDGVQCTKCTFSGVTFEYGGGAYELSQSVVNLPIAIAPKGAALNTVGLLNSLGL